jgi:hypothetical protein
VITSVGPRRSVESELASDFSVVLGRRDVDILGGGVRREDDICFLILSVNASRSSETLLLLRSLYSREPQLRKDA